MKPPNPSPEKSNPAEQKPLEEGKPEVVYDSAVKPLLWLLIPFVLLILYGALH